MIVESLRYDPVLAPAGIGRTFRYDVLGPNLGSTGEDAPVANWVEPYLHFLSRGGRWGRKIEDTVQPWLPLIDSMVPTPMAAMAAMVPLWAL